MSAPELPPLPHGFPIQMTPDPEGTPFVAYDADQMQAYATAAVLAERGKWQALLAESISLYNALNRAAWSDGVLPWNHTSRMTKLTADIDAIRGTP